MAVCEHDNITHTESVRLFCTAIVGYRAVEISFDEQTQKLWRNCRIYHVDWLLRPQAGRGFASARIGALGGSACGIVHVTGIPHESNFGRSNVFDSHHAEHLAGSRKRSLMVYHASVK